jgi:hypothetical protein
VRELPEERRPLPCFVHHPDAGGLCERPAIIEVYGLAFCEIHGAEVKAGALAELFQDATEELERPNNPHVPELNPAALLARRSSVSLLTKACVEAETEGAEAMRRAYPLIPERVCGETVAFFKNKQIEEPLPGDVYQDARFLLHRFMRLAYDAKHTWLVEVLEGERESVAAQAAFAFEHYSRWRKRNKEEPAD